VIDLRRLAAVDVAFLGSKIILTEFAVGVLGPIVLGILTLRKSHSMGGMIFGVYLLLIGVNFPRAISDRNLASIERAVLASVARVHLLDDLPFEREFPGKRWFAGE
jgi:hypothetical protein